MTERSLKETTLDGVRWVMLGRGASEVLALAAAVALARMVSPAEFGRAAVALILVPLATILTFEGFASALVQRPSFEEEHRRAAVLMSLLAGVTLTIVVVLVAPLLGDRFFGPEIAGLLQLVAPVFTIASLGAVSRATLWRNLDFPRTSRIDVLSLLCGCTVSVSLAVAGLDARAIVLGALAQTTASTLQLVLAAPPPLPRWDARAQREITAFGLPAASAGLVHVLFSNIDYAILAARLSAAQTGIYWRAFNLGVTYQDKLSNVMLQVAFPVYSRTRDHDELRALHSRATRVHAAVIVPLLATLIVLAPVLVPFVFGDAWRPSVRPAQILALAGMCAAILTGYSQVMLAVGKPRELLRFNVGMLAVYAAGVSVAATHGLVTVAAVVAGIYVAILAAVYRLLLQRHVGIPMAALVSELRPAVVGAAALLAAGLPLRRGLEAVGAPDAAVIVVAGAAGLAVYAAVLRTVFSAVWDDLWMLAERVVPQLGRLARHPLVGRVTAEPQDPVEPALRAMAAEPVAAPSAPAAALPASTSATAS
jgi:O-antigen/teichoic acid export membrane protein